MRRSSPARPALLVAALALATSCGGTTAPRATPSPTPVRTVTQSPTPTTTPSAAASPSPSVSRLRSPVTLVIGGDVDFDRTTRTAVARGGVDAPWLGIAPRLRAADIALLNLECALSERGVREQKSYTFRGDPDHVVGARRAGVDVFSLANNHTLDFGVGAFADTIAAVRRVGIEPVGGGMTLADAQRAAVLTVRGVRVAVVGISAIIPAPKWRATATRPGFAYDDDAQITAQVRAARARADVVVAYFHWGVEYRTTPSSAQRRAARAAIRAGATLVAGTHPHVLQPIEVVDGRLVAWSLSNLVFQSTPRSVRTALLTVTLQPSGAVDWRTDPYLITEGIPRPDASRQTVRGTVPPVR